jgi:hypothetical protein
VSDPATEQRVLGHITAIAARGHDDHIVLADALLTYSWPDGGADGTNSEAVAWFKRHAARLPGDAPTPIPVTCGCHINRCLICN